MKRRIALILGLVMCMGCAPAARAAEPVPMEEVTAQAAICMDSATGTVVYEKNADTHLPIASVTKTMTLLLLFEEMERGTFGLEDTVTVSADAAGMGGSQVLLEAGGSYRAGDLIKSIIVASGNDASVAMAEFVAGSHANFVARMNERARELGMEGAVFYNCTGLTADDGRDNLLTARHVAQISRMLVGYPVFFQYSRIWTDEIMHPGGRITMLTNTNKLLRSCEGVDGIKTGSTDNAGSCITASANRDGTRLIAVVLGGSSSAKRFEEAAAMLNYGFGHYRSVKYVEAGTVLQQGIPVAGGKEETVNGIAAHAVWDFVSRQDAAELERTVTVRGDITAPVAAGEVIGQMILTSGGVPIGTVDIVSDRDVEAAGFFDVLGWLLEDWFG